MKNNPPHNAELPTMTTPLLSQYYKTVPSGVHKGNILYRFVDADADPTDLDAEWGEFHHPHSDDGSSNNNNSSFNNLQQQQQQFSSSSAMVKPVLSTLQLAAFTFLISIGGSYGFEGCIQAAGPLLSVAFTLILPWVWC
eukprot:PhM_4_TR7926/c0_g1_i1/m.41290